jgi:hypothetical protein
MAAGGAAGARTPGIALLITCNPSVPTFPYCALNLLVHIPIGLATAQEGLHPCNCQCIRFFYHPVTATDAARGCCCVSAPPGRRSGSVYDPYVRLSLKYPTERPRIVTVTCQPTSPGTTAPPDGVNVSAPIVHHFFPSGRPESLVLTEGLNGEALHFPLQLWYCPTSLANSRPINRAIAKITSGQAEREWCGPAVVLKFNGYV